MKKEFLNLLNGSTELLEDITKDGGGGKPEGCSTMGERLK